MPAVIKNLNQVTPLADDTVALMLGVAFPKYQVVGEADDLYEARRTVWYGKGKELDDGVAHANIVRTQYYNHPKATEEGKSRVDADLAKAQKRRRAHDAKQPQNTFHLREINEAIAKWGRGWRDRSKPAVRPVEIVRDKDEPAALAERVPYYADRIKANAAVIKTNEGMVLPRAIVGERVRDNTNNLLKQCRPNVKRTQRMHKDEDGRLRQGNVHFPMISRFMGGALVDEPNWGLMALWTVRESFTQQLVDLALQGFDDNADTDLAARETQLAALDAERKRLMYCAEAALADCHAAGIDSARTWTFDALFYLGVELNT
jgi:hypothetical protein